MYNDFARVYDSLMYDIDYIKWADYIESVLKKYSKKAELILDLGCGTGSFCIEMAGRGYDMIGVDISADMLSYARQKAIDQKRDILFLNQDMTDFELYGTVDCIVCLLDSLNYITTKRDVLKLFKLAANYLNPDGLFIFDINTCYKLEKVLGDNVFYDVDEDITYIWQNKYDKKRKVCEFDLTFFINEGETYTRHDETHYERAYTADELKLMLNAAGLELLNIYDGLTFRKPFPKSERIFFLCRNIK